MQHQSIRAVHPEQFDSATAQTPGSKRTTAIHPGAGVSSPRFQRVFVLGKPGTVAVVEGRSLQKETPRRRGRYRNAPNPSANDLAIKLNEMREELLVSAAKSGDAVAFVELSKRHSTKILRQVYRILKNWQDAEDVLQESLLRAFLHLKDFEERCSFSSWLTRIAINFALMSLRKKRGHIEISMEVINDDHGIRHRWEPKDPAENPESRCSRREREELLEGAIRQLPPTLRQIVQMKIIDGRSGEEVSQTLGISVPAAKSRLARAKTALRVSLASGDR